MKEHRASDSGRGMIALDGQAIGGARSYTAAAIVGSPAQLCEGLYLKQASLQFTMDVGAHRSMGSVAGSDGSDADFDCWI